MIEGHPYANALAISGAKGCPHTLWWKISSQRDEFDQSQPWIYTEAICTIGVQSDDIIIPVEHWLLCENISTGSKHAEYTTELQSVTSSDHRQSLTTMRMALNNSKYTAVNHQLLPLSEKIQLQCSEIHPKDEYALMKLSSISYNILHIMSVNFG